MKHAHSLLLLAAALTAYSCSGSHGKADGSDRDDVPQVAVALPQVDSVTLHRTYPGFITANAKVNVVARVNGTLESVRFQGGQFVDRGQVLYTIESTTYADAVRSAEAELQNATSQQEYCAQRLAAMEKAFASNAVSQMDVAQARNNLEQAEAAISSARAELNDARTNLNYCTVRAPGAGYIASNKVDPGNYVSGGASPVVLTTIYDTRRVSAEFSIEAAQYEELVGESGGTDAPIYRDVPLTFQVDLPHSYSADLYYTAPNVEKNTGTVLIKGQVDNPHGDLKDGMFVSVDLPFGTEPHAILVRDASISTDQRGKYLYVVGPDNKVEYRPITVSQTYQDTLRIVESGLKPDERYVTDALLTVRPGMTVKPVLTK